MTKQLKSKIKQRINIAKEDLRILQKMITKRSVYKSAKKDIYSRRPKHPKNYLEFIEI